jgi:NAD(P)-dependent dehydrogenase (short-subunit alcohol dehydrogenase family)
MKYRSGIIVVGGSSGLGFSCVERFLSSGHSVLSLSRRGTGPEGAANCHFDLQYYSIGKPFKDFGFGDTLLIAGGMGAFYGPHNLTLEKFDAMFSTNARGPILMANDFLQIKRHEKKRARIVIVTSTAARHGGHGLGVYAASKAAVEAWVRAESPHQGKRGVSILAASLGWFESPMTDALDPEVRKKAEAKCPLGRFATLDEATDCVVGLTLRTQYGPGGDQRGDRGVFSFWEPNETQR